MKTEVKERRKHPRLPLSIPVFVRGRDERGAEFLEFATALNVSAGGILLVSRRDLSISAAGISLEIPLAPTLALAAPPPSVRSLKARLVRVTHEGRFHLAGLKFLRPLLP